jgi:hypothetical protein
MQHSSEPGSKRNPSSHRSGVATLAHHIDCDPHEGAVVFRCEACGHEIRDLRSVFLAHRPGAGWTVECSGHPDAELAMDAGHLFGGGLRSVELFADLARARWFDPADLFEALTRLRAQARGVYRKPAGRG